MSESAAAWSPTERVLQVLQVNITKTWALLSSCQQPQPWGPQPAAASWAITWEFLLRSSMLRPCVLLVLVTYLLLQHPILLPRCLSLSRGLSCTCSTLRLVLSSVHLGLCWSRCNAGTLLWCQSHEQRIRNTSLRTLERFLGLLFLAYFSRFVCLSFQTRTFFCNKIQY